METKEYLWWVETIRQNHFRELLPINICLYVSTTICLITFIFGLLVTSVSHEIKIVFLGVGFVSLLIVLLCVFAYKFYSKEAVRQIKAVKKLWEVNKNETDNINNDLLHFFVISKK
jgi:hypothetical protein